MAKSPRARWPCRPREQTDIQIELQRAGTDLACVGSQSRLDALLPLFEPKVSQAFARSSPSWSGRSLVGSDWLTQTTRWWPASTAQRSQASSSSTRTSWRPSPGRRRTSTGTPARYELRTTSPPEPSKAARRARPSCARSAGHGASLHDFAASGLRPSMAGLDVCFWPIVLKNSVRRGRRGVVANDNIHLTS